MNPSNSHTWTESRFLGAALSILPSSDSLELSPCGLMSLIGLHLAINPSNGAVPS